ncbi:hypothetical protein E1293_00025 [Actinomadura darangshiensis]|uniref:Uncharacterized protein n=1 Tax=Actinomadura darangshiensis TaxID=705336 RepID=A0A4R5C4A3_9ACTN|nr:hypothetical protein [Actinomadura darangshiensis]TDD92903.1 hypothetical protein E1293_00025 [Actinomadura darangshiensis]
MGQVSPAPSGRRGQSASPGAASRPGPACHPRTGGAPLKVTCPDVRSRLPRVPASQQAVVARDLNLLDSRIAEADRRLKKLIDRINISFQRAGQQSPGPVRKVYGFTDHAGLRLITCGGTYLTRRHRHLDNIIVYAELLPTG